MIYLSGSSSEIERVKAAAAGLKAAGIEIAKSGAEHWWVSVERRRAAGLADHDLSPEEARTYADADLDAVADSDAVVLLWPEVTSFGAGWECGFAEASEITILIVGTPTHPFAQLADHIFPTLGGAIAYLRGTR